MTLIISAILKDIIVVAADGAEYHHYPGKPKSMEVTNRRKIFPLSGRSIVLAAHGQNRLTSAGKGLDAQRLIGDILNDLSPQFLPISTVEGIAHKLLELLQEDVAHTFACLKADGIHQSALGITVYGFDAIGGRSQCYEAFWPLLDQNEKPNVIRIAHDSDDVRIAHSGSAAAYAKAIIDVPLGRYHPDRLISADIEAIQDYVRRAYRVAEEIQPPDLPEFAGEYHEMTITIDNCSCTTPRATARL